MHKYSPNVVFTPLMDKQDSLYVGHCPGKSFFPGPNTFLAKIPKLYVELNNIESLDIFGISPFGDVSLIKQLTSILDLRIYVYNMDKKQVDKWKELLNRDCCVDSSSFYNK